MFHGSVHCNLPVSTKASLLVISGLSGLTLDSGDEFGDSDTRSNSGDEFEDCDTRSTPERVDHQSIVDNEVHISFFTIN